MIAIYESNDFAEATLLKTVLESAQIECHLEGEYLLGGVGELPAALPLKIWVQDESATQAKTLIEGYQSASPVFPSDHQ